MTAASGHPLTWYLTELVARIGAGDTAALARLRGTAGTRTAWIELSGESATVRFTAAGDFVVAAVTGSPDPAADGFGSTRHEVVLAILAGDLDATDAVVDGEVEVRGPAEAVIAMFTAIEILLDGATRVPALRELAGVYRTEHPVAPSGRHRRRTPIIEFGGEPSGLADPAQPAPGADH